MISPHIWRPRTGSVMQATIFYQTSDDVNLRLALQFAGEFKASLVHSPRGRPAAFGTLAASLNDLDHMFPEQRDATLRELLAAPAVTPVAVHGYGLDDGQVGGLVENSVLVSPNLMPALIRGLCRAFRRDEGPIPIAPDPDGGDVADPAELGRLVRSAASEAHRMIAREVDCPEELDELRQKIDRVRCAVDRLRRDHSLPLMEVGHWLDRLDDKLDDRFGRGPM